ncbi:family 1 encapsulin nanocompartment shell protein [Polyangium aurulentum]|uniref:family 1 encapsulin nanocompartment shell protein n=1 Tax=Polyangium aurulentum TaxID=2567896 RepID=UPI0010ADBB4B|nr:family 1 encapsulin nanocompartment shell protein [Polyangium aurulentum]UQA61113.1 bacteriocin family protein [Polyangium aurulentum]
MPTDLLKRELAPILPEAWEAIDAEARRVLELNLTARKLVDFRGPFGWEYASVSTGRLRMLSQQPVPDVSVGVRAVQPLVELRTPILLDSMELDTVARGADDADLSPVLAAAEKIARAEDGAIFNGYGEGNIAGIIPSSPHPPVRVPAVQAWPLAVVTAKEILRAAGISGPYALALGRREYDELAAGTEDGYPILKRIERQLVDGPVVWAPAIEGAVLMSVRGGDFELTVGQDLSIGYAYHERQKIELYLTESFTFRVLEPAAAVALRRT